MIDAELISAIDQEIARMDKKYGVKAYGEIKRLAKLASERLKETLE